MSANFKVALLRELERGFSTDGEVRGVARATEEGGKTEISLSVVRLVKKTGYEFLFYGDDGLKRMPLEDETGGEFTICGKAEFASAAIAYAPEKKIVAFGRFSPASSGAEEICAAYGKDGESAEYDDFALATENYYEFDEKTSKENGNGEQKSVYAGAENDDTFGGAESGETEESLSFEKADFRAGVGKSGYYGRISDKISELFGKFPEEESLSGIVADSKWIGINYEGDKNYVVGVIKENGSPRYICYGVRGKYGEKPEELGNYCSFIPASLFQPKADGFWVMYQDADTGDKIK